MLPDIEQFFAQYEALSHDPAPTAEQIEALQHRAARLLDNVAGKLASAPATHLAELIDAYNMLHIAVHHTAPHPKATAEARNRLFEAWQNNPKEIAESDIYGVFRPLMLQPHNKRTPNNTVHPSDHTLLTPGQSLAVIAMRDRWLSDLDETGTIAGVTTHELLRRLTLLSSEPGIEIATKREWYERHLITDFGGLSTTLLRAYRRYLQSLLPDSLDYDDYLDLDSRLLTLLHTHPAKAVK